MFPVKYIIFGVTFILGAIILYSLLVQRSDNVKTEQGNKKISGNTEKIRYTERIIVKSQNCDSLITEMRKQNEAKWQTTQKKYDDEKKKRKTVARATVNDDDARHIAELRELADYFESADYKQTINDNRTP